MKNVLSKERILFYLGKTHINYRLYIYDSIPSSNELAKKMIYTQKATSNSIIITNTQTAGLGRVGRSFFHHLAESI